MFLMKHGIKEKIGQKNIKENCLSHIKIKNQQKNVFNVLLNVTKERNKV